MSVLKRDMATPAGAQIPILGLVGGMAAESTILYYRGIIRSMAKPEAPLHTPEILICSLNLGEMYDWLAAGQKERVIDRIATAAQSLESIGAQVIALCSNTAHLAVDAISGRCAVPLLGIGDALAMSARDAGARRIGILGTGFMLAAQYIRSRISHHGIDLIEPTASEIEILDHYIFRELSKGIVSDSAIIDIAAIIQRMIECGAEYIVLACTELSLMRGKLPRDEILFDSTEIHILNIIHFLSGNYAQGSSINPDGNPLVLQS